jgi:hypothetical protein
MHAMLIAILAVLLTAPPAFAIVNGEPDDGRHPAVGLLAFEEAGQHYILCSGWYAGPHRDDASLSVFVTAGHCLGDFPTEGPPQLRVTFEDRVDQSEEGFPRLPVSAASWHTAAGWAAAEDGDYGVVLLQGPVGHPAIGLPPARRLDDLAARNRLRPRTLFDNVGYGVSVENKEFLFPDRRMYSESKFLGLTKTTMKLLTNEDADEEYGGVCYFDSGGPVLEHGTQRAVALISGRGDPGCRAKFDPPRVDIPQARAFYGEYLELP